MISGAARYNGYFDEVLHSAVNKADDLLNSINKWVYKKVYDLSDGLGLIPEPVGGGKIPYEAPENIKKISDAFRQFIYELKILLN